MPEPLAPAVPATADNAPRRLLWPWYLAFAAPFALCLLILLVTGRALPVFWAGDEVDHWFLAGWFADRLPHFHAVYPHTATTPLFHLLGAVAIRLFGPSLTMGRTLNVVFSLTGVFALFGLLWRTMRHSPATAALLSAVYLTSCYFFGYSFRWLTDNLALTFCIFALAQLFRAADPAELRPLRSYFLGCLACSLTILTRQNYMFLCLPFALALPLSGQRAGTVVAGWAGLALAVAPFAGLVLVWHGLVPPDYQHRHTSSLINYYPVTLPLMLLGMYTPFFVGPELWRWTGPIPWACFRWPAVAALGGLVVLWMFPLVPLAGQSTRSAFFPAAAREDVPGYFAGWIYHVGMHLPKLHGNSLFFWALLPVGLAAAAWFLQAAAQPGADPLGRVAVLFLLGLLLSSMLNAICAQKYYDAPVLLFLIWHSQGEAARDPLRRAALGGLILLFCAYFAFFTSTAEPTPARTITPDAPALHP